MAEKKKTTVTRKRVAMTDTERVKNQPYDIDVIPETERPSTRSKLANWVVVGALVLIALSLGIFFKWASADENVLVVKNAPFPVRTIREHPTGGGVVFLNVNVCKNSDIVGQNRMSFISPSREVFLPIAEEGLPKGCLDREIPIVIPKDLPPDTYRVKFRVTYNLNPLKQGIVDEFESKEFIVDPITQ